MDAARNTIPVGSYGILYQDTPRSEIDDIAEQVMRIGYAILDSGYNKKQLESLSRAFDQTRKIYLNKYGKKFLKDINELYTIRALLTQGDPLFVSLATNKKLLNVLSKLIMGKFILNQQNGVINPARKTYNQGTWHRDLPYQHFVSNTPLAVNALFCLDDFTTENGSTFVLPASHRSVNYPSSSYIRRNAFQVEAKAGQFILLDCMLFHSGGFNKTKYDRRAVNHVYSIPYFKQQINLPAQMQHLQLNVIERELFGFNFLEPISIGQFLNNRHR